MKLITIILLSTALSVSAAGFGQKVTLSLKNAALPQVFKELNRQTGYEFFYNADLLDKASKVTISPFRYRRQL